MSQGCVSGQGFSLHADVHCGPHQRHTLERLCRYITRPALGHKRLSRTPTGEVVLQLRPLPDLIDIPRPLRYVSDCPNIPFEIPIL